MTPSNPFLESPNCFKDEIQGTHDSNSCNLPRPNSFDPLFSHPNSFPRAGLNGDHRQGTSRHSQIFRDRRFAKDDTQKDARSIMSTLFQHEQESTCPAHKKQNVFDFYKKTSESGPQFYPVKTALKQEELVMPLRQWIALDAQESAAKLDQSYRVQIQKASTLRKVTISYAVANLLQHLSLHFQIMKYSSVELRRLCQIDNFVIRVQVSTEQSDLGWEVMGVDMIDPQLQLQIITGVSSGCNFFDVVNEDEFTGRSIIPKIVSPDAKPGNTVDSRITNDESMLCHFLGLLLHGLFSGEDLTLIKPQAFQKDEKNYQGNPSTNKTSSESVPHLRCNEFSLAISASRADSKHCLGKASVEANLLHPLSTIGYSNSLSQVVTNLVDCGLGLFRSGDSYTSLEMAIDDLSLLLEEPGRFLFEDFQLSPKEQGIIYSDIGNCRLYGRTVEARLLTDTFCRIASTGESEAILIGGFTGYVC